MRTFEIKIYQFSELSEEAKEKAIQWGAELNISHDWWEFTYDDATNIGLKIDSFDLYRREINGEILNSATDTATKIIEDHGEECDTYKLASVFLMQWANLVSKYSDGIKTDIVAEENEGQFDEEANELEAEFKRELLEEYLCMRDREYHYLTSEEAIIETIEANEYEFTEDGEIY